MAQTAAKTNATFSSVDTSAEADEHQGVGSNNNKSIKSHRQLFDDDDNTLLASPTNNNVHTTSSSSSWLSPVVLCILWTETAERFAYFGFRAILVLYFTLSLHYSEANSIALYAYMTSLAYLTPLLGALLADGSWGCYPTILWFGVIYALGLMMVTYAASLADDAVKSAVVSPVTATVTAAAAATTTTSSATFWQQFFSFGGLLLVCIGTGGIKPCVSAFGANQVAAAAAATPSHVQRNSCTTEPPLEEHDDITSDTASSTSSDLQQQQQPHMQDFFAYFYFCINVGAVLSIGTIPLAREYYGFAAAFGIPTLFMWGAVFLFWSKRKEYIHQSPSNTLGATLIICCQLIYQRWCRTSTSHYLTMLCRPCHECWTTVRRRMNSVGRTPLPQTMGQPALVPTHTKDDDDEDGNAKNHSVGDDSAITYSHSVLGGSKLLLAGTMGRSRNYGSHHPFTNDNTADGGDVQLIRDAEQALRVLPIMAMFPIFWMLYDQQGSVWTLQATRMRLHGLQPEQFTLVNPIEIMIFIPLFQQVIYPYLTRHGWNLTPLSRIRMGMVLAAISFFASGLLESAIQRTELLQTLDHAKTLPPSVFWQLIQITILAVSEILVSVTGLEWAYDTAPQRIKALLMAMFLLTTAVGDLLVSQSSFVQAVDDDDESTANTLSGSRRMDDRVVASSSRAPFSDNQPHQRQFKELTTRSSSIMGVELPTVQHDVLE